VAMISKAGMTRELVKGWYAAATFLARAMLACRPCWPRAPSPGAPG